MVSAAGDGRPLGGLAFRCFKGRKQLEYGSDRALKNLMTSKGLFGYHHDLKYRKLLANFLSSSPASLRLPLTLRLGRPWRCDGYRAEAGAAKEGLRSQAILP
jgi:hypothetical protein